LASSSSYLIAAIKAVSLFINVNLSDFEICKLALLLERKFNPLTGFQDSFGCGIGGFKKIECFYKKDPVITFLKSNSFDLKILPLRSEFLIAKYLRFGKR
jgi:D-glycero-alpha-D-manno-heptose-7-phosphate kinase